MEFKKYQHIERLGTDETAGIEIGNCFVFPKIDGTNSQLWWNDGLQAGSRNRHLEIGNDNAGFYDWALKQDKFKDFFTEYPDLRLYGEWLVPHTLKTYTDTAWKNYYVFDVLNENCYLSYDEYKPILERFGIDFIPPICSIKNPTYERLIGMLEKNTYLIENGNGFGEGIVIKNYDYVNKYGRVCWAKIVRNEFKDKHHANQTTKVKEKKLIEDEIVNKYVTIALIEKELAKIKIECDGWSSKHIPRLLNTVYYCLITEECWNFVKEHRNPTIDFKRLFFFTTNKIKELKPEMF